MVVNYLVRFNQFEKSREGKKKGKGECWRKKLIGVVAAVCSTARSKGENCVLREFGRIFRRPQVGKRLCHPL